ncbi:serine hydrolase [Chitinophaga sp. Cy-1792]|uniref:serine hydrolase domain-containing protein n=1 Tax=Chitinophaga sp. Cy-1792 TaxID=2608339 RepID=UPI00141F1E52|nr:serine hydrolase domain-containing protein [Chitinophaga sp. Cy-1792]NIG55706.1 beta-lactamase family protein [Chitinophaga sp. Cy-1792]
MKKAILFLVVSLIVNSLKAQTDSEKLDEVMQAATNAHLFNGVALIARHDSILLFKGYGWRNYEQQIPHDTNSVFQIGSTTKPFTATVILWLREQHLLDLSDKLSKYFPSYRYGNQITIKNLLTHTSGIYNFTDQHYLANLADKPFHQRDFWKIVADKPLEFLPDTRFSYSNSNYMILGYIIEQVSGKSYEQMVREVIFEKAGMTHSGFDYRHLSSLYKSAGYDTLDLKAPQRARLSDSSATYAAGAMYTTAADLYRFSQAMYNNKIISQASQEEAFTPYKGNYGYGWYIEFAPGLKFMAHNGGIWGFQSHFKRIPQDHVSIILLRNEMLGFEDYAISLHRILYHDPNYYIPRPSVALTTDSMLPYIGEYQLKDKPAFKANVAVRDGNLYLTWTNLAPEKMYAEKTDQFFFKSYNCQIAYTRDPQGKITGFVAHNPGQDFPYEKIR